MIEKIIQKNILYPEIIWERPVHYYKNQGGRIFILAGSRGSANKASLVCEAVFRSGTGIITLGFPDILKNLYKDFLPEEMTLLLPSTPGGTIAQKSKEMILEQIKSSDVILVGPGISVNSETIHLIWDVIINATKTVVICDDAIFAFIKGIEVLRSKEDEKYLIDYFRNIKNELVIILSVDDIFKILHATKFNDYTKPNISFIKKHLDEILSFLSKKFNSTFFANESEQIIVKDEKVIINLNKYKKEIISVELVSAIISSFIGQNPDKIIESAATASFLLNSALNLAHEKDIEKRIMSSDILREIPEAIKKAEKI